MRMSKKKMFIIGIILIVFLLAYNQYIAREKGKKNFKIFDKAKIESTLKIDSYIISKGSGIKLEDGSEYVFYPHTDRILNKNKIFNYEAKKGDKIIKEEYSDTLLLIKQGKVLKYTFVRLE